MEERQKGLLMDDGMKKMLKPNKIWVKQNVLQRSGSHQSNNTVLDLDLHEHRSMDTRSWFRS